MAVACSVASPPCHQYSSSPVRYVFRDAAAVRRDDRCSTRLRFDRRHPVLPCCRSNATVGQKQVSADTADKCMIGSTMLSAKSSFA